MSKPLVIREGRFTVKTYGPPREHRPPHVHVFVRGTDAYVVVRLAMGDRPAGVRDVVGDLRLRDIKEAVALVAKHDTRLRAQWEKLHGD